MSDNILYTLKEKFKTSFGQSPQFFARSPGRVNIIGEHTDYNDGYVFPVGLQFSAYILATPRSDNTINVISLQYPEEKESFSLEKPIQPGELAWGNFIRGTVLEFNKRGHSLSGCDILITSDVPQGCGLSSSAALEVALGGIFNEMFDCDFLNTEIALIGQATENNFINCQCGIMDQLVSAEAVDGHAVLIDCRDLSFKPIKLPNDQAILIINSNFPRKLSDSEYNERRAACELAASTMGVESLRDANLSMLHNVKNHIDNTTFCRAKHVITENERVLNAIESLENNDINTFYQSIHDAQESIKNDFEITVPATQYLVKLCNDALLGNGAARQTGGGFGGAVVCICHTDDVQKVTDMVNNHYTDKFNLIANIYVCKASSGLTTSSL